MAKDAKDKAAKAIKKAKKAQNKKTMSGKARVFFVIAILVALVFLPTSLLLCAGMLPSIVALMTSSTGRGARPSTVAALNMAGCVPYVFKLWQSGNDFEMSFEIITDPRAIIIMYTAAVFGYLLDFVVTSLVSSYMYQKGELRQKMIQKRQAVLISRWGDDIYDGIATKEDVAAFVRKN